METHGDLLAIYNLVGNTRIVGVELYSSAATIVPYTALRHSTINTFWPVLLVVTYGA
jgi:hypothetical protein